MFSRFRSLRGGMSAAGERAAPSFYPTGRAFALSPLRCTSSPLSVESIKRTLTMQINNEFRAVFRKPEPDLTEMTAEQVRTTAVCSGTHRVRQARRLDEKR